MFTGIIRALSTATFNPETQILTLNTAENVDFWGNYQCGDSICVNGTCLTIFDDNDDKLVNFYLQKETLQCTTFGLPEYQNSQIVNLEKSMSVTDRFDGHIVLGHVHGYGTVKNILHNSDNSKEIFIELCLCPKELQHTLYKKSSITINGISLTIADIVDNNSTIRVSIIPYTWMHTNLQYINIGSKLNIEFASFDNVEPKTHEYWMKQAIAIGNNGRLTSAPNPWVGCIIVRDNKVIVGSGFHKKCGTDHAEIVAIKDMNNHNDSSNTSTNSTLAMYVTLEPCNHIGRTGPCTKAIIESGIKKVIIALIDPDSLVHGQGIKHLRDNDIYVIVGICEQEAKESLEPYLIHRNLGIPQCILKIGMSLDGRIACQDKSSRWITNESSRNNVQKLRSSCQAILIGVNTALIDNPMLVPQTEPNNPILRVILDTRGRLTSGTLIDSAKIYNTLIYTSDYVSKETLQLWDQANVNYEIVRRDEDDQVCLYKVLYSLGKRGILQLLVEGGPTIHKSFLKMQTKQHGSVLMYVYLGGNLLGSSAIPWIQSTLTNTITDSKNITLHVRKTETFGQNDVLIVYTADIGIQDTLDIFNTQESSIQEAIDTIKSGNMVIVMDAQDRENEGDFVMAARYCDSNHLQKMIRYTSGILCAPMTQNQAEQLRLPIMISNNQDKHNTAFTVSCDSSKYITTGISAKDRAMTFRVLGTSIDSNDLNRPGHIFPLIARPGLLQERCGHTEASVTLCKLADIEPPVAAIGEIMNDDGTIARRPDLFKFAKFHGIPIVSIESIKKYCETMCPIDTIKYCTITGESKLDTDPIIANCTIPISFHGKSFGLWNLYCFKAYEDPIYQTTFSDTQKSKIRVALIKNSIFPSTLSKSVIVRIHSACFTGDIFGSEKCDCGRQLYESIKYIHEQGHGIFIYETEHEGRGIGLVDKIKAYHLMENDKGLDTYSANHCLGYCDDIRSYLGSVEILKYFNVTNINLLTGNPDKAQCLKEHGFNVQIISDVVSLPKNQHNDRYIDAKFQKGFNYKSFPEFDFNIENDKLQDLKITIITASWNSQYTFLLRDTCIEVLYEQGLLESNIVNVQVPGAFEIPAACSKYLLQSDVVICIGVLIKGESLHFEYISDSVINALMQLQINHKKPVIYGILNVLNVDQANERASKNSGLGRSWAMTALQMHKVLNM